MNEQHKIDPIDEALRILWLEAAESDESSVSKLHLDILFTESNLIPMAPVKNETLIQKLYASMQSSTLGELISQAVKDNPLSDQAIAAEFQIPAKIFTDLKNDMIFPNNIPIILLRNLFKKLGISFKQAEQSILKTFDLMKNRENISYDFKQAAFRKANNANRDSFMKLNNKADGRELFENDESLKKYLLKLEELMH